MGTTEHEEPRFFFILNKGAKSGGEITHAVLNGSIVSKPAGWDAFHGLALAREKLSSEEIQQQMKELGKMKDLFNSEQLEALRHHFPNISKAMEEGKDLLKQITRSRGFGMGM